MISLFKSLFGSSDNDDAGSGRRRLSQPQDLQLGDIIKFKFMDHDVLSGKQFEVTKVNTYFYGSVSMPEFALTDSEGNTVYMVVEDEDEEEYLEISKVVKKSQIDEILSDAVINDILKAGRGGKLLLSDVPDQYLPWVSSKKYKKTEDAVKGSFAKGDVRTVVSSYELTRENFVYYTLVDKSDEYGMELAVYENGEMELSLTSYLELNQIEEMWPAS